MRKISSLLIIFSAFMATGLVSCGSYGKKIKVEGTKGEVFYIEDATENEARQVGDFLKEDGFLKNEKGASVQVAKQNGEYTVRFVYNKEYFEKTEGLENIFKQYGIRMSKTIFNGKKVAIALADKQFKDFKTIPYDEALAKADEGVLGETFRKSDFEHEKDGDVNFYWKGISEEESATITNYIKKNGAFSGGASEIYITKNGDHYLLRFPVLKEFRTNPETIETLEKVSKQIKENVFPNERYTFQMTDENLIAVKTFEY